jgi:hypothetical protein
MEIGTFTCNQKRLIVSTLHLYAKESTEAIERILGEFLVPPLNRKMEMASACELDLVDFTLLPNYSSLGKCCYLTNSLF